MLLFIEGHAAYLENWHRHRHILTMLRDEMPYFWPQIET
ncbi:SpoVR family protein [Paenibacillus hamazuiensis]